MGTYFRKFTVFLNKHIWADFLFVFIIYGAGIIFINEVVLSDFQSLKSLLVQVALFALFMTPVNRFLRKMYKPNPMELGDHAAYFTKGQRPQLKAYLESKGYTINRNDGATTYFDPNSTSKSHLIMTYIFETDHWMALIASPEIQSEVPSHIDRLYPSSEKLK